mmetsp:Transcript_40630/g.90335  ORF Transcript_40630/g.90335 Transcript_40630/m.90335 type:complete len:129 (-) Transcript_40630:436-822(-)|eukprot:CAMPEP_0202894438 /NCGR_PEP_ID=MMETSP1392-20130828/3853_1 /ASSEMBLY_ACC=CAM_ASM_000868 /TAXON_ID=225041 /ORGANISM="Chlamydomonas chlamydogama, Strain SAG 11-48b" /LENGTH=128 /DNA_ID=CAMNT_0049579143 /DNA_START=58 /DNA_END=444 /DNA_ORIENTATION=-
MLTASKVSCPRPFVSGRQVAAPKRAFQFASARKAENAQRVVMVRAAEEEVEAVEDAGFEDTGIRRRGEEKPEFKHFLPLPKPAHLIYIKPTVAVVAGVAPRSSVGVKMTAGGNQLERYVVEYFARSVK